jgi:hypothetical protein
VWFIQAGMAVSKKAKFLIKRISTTLNAQRWIRSRLSAVETRQLNHLNWAYALTAVKTGFSVSL